jgi:hypothetical protein
VRGTPRSGGTLLIFFIIASRSIAYTLASRAGFRYHVTADTCRYLIPDTDT